MKLRILIFLIIPLSFLAYEENNKDHIKNHPDNKIISKVAAWKERKSVEFKLLLKIGTDNFDKEQYIFGNISDIKVDQYCNIYVLDIDNYRVQKFSEYGKYLQTIGGIKGVGPGELSEPRRLAINNQGNVYISDISPPRISIFDSNGKFVKSITLRFLPGNILIGKRGKLYITEVKSHGDYWVHKYNISDGKLEGSLCEKKENNDLIKRSGHTGNLCSDKEGNIYFSYFYPYEIRKYSDNEELLLCFSRKVPFFKPPERVKPFNYINKYVIRARSGSSGIISLPDGKIINFIRHLEFKKLKIKEQHFYFDVFDKNGTWLLAIPLTKIDPDLRVMKISSDYHGNIYLVYSEPFPHIRKYSMKFFDK